MNTEFPFIEDCCRNENNIERQKIQEIHIIIKKCRIVTFAKLKNKRDIMITIRNKYGKIIYNT